eukprot:4355569-Prymnesium_polylepis.1
MEAMRRSCVRKGTQTRQIRAHTSCETYTLRTCPAVGLPSPQECTATHRKAAEASATGPPRSPTIGLVNAVGVGPPSRGGASCGGWGGGKTAGV